MSGHSKWSTIKRKKGANDAQRAIVESQCFVDYQWKEWLQSEVEDEQN